MLDCCACFQKVTRSGGSEETCIHLERNYRLSVRCVPRDKGNHLIKKAGHDTAMYQADVVLVII